MLAPKDFVRDADAMGRTWALEESLAYTRWMATGHYENFHGVSFLLPKHLHQDFYNVYSFCRWADDLGDEIGDFYDHITVPGQPLNLLIGCVNGTGTTATLLSMMAKTQYREQVALMDQLNRPDLLLSGMIQAFSNPHDSPWTIKGVCASYDSHTGTLRWSGAGDLLGLKIDAQGKIIPLQDTQGLALGLQFQNHYPMHTVQIQAGEQVLWMTSAWGHLPVARNIDSASKGLQSLIQTPPQVHGPALIERIARAWDESMRSALPRRGLSCLLLHRKV